jgi:hypothetical protein
MLARMLMMAITTSISIKVNASSREAVENRRFTYSQVVINTIQGVNQKWCSAKKSKRGISWWVTFEELASDWGDGRSL